MTGLKPVSLEKTSCKRLLKFKNRSVKVIEITGRLRLFVLQQPVIAGLKLNYR